MKTALTAIVLAVGTGLSGCAVVPYDPVPYYDEPYYGSRRYYSPPAVVVPQPIYVPRYGHRPHHRGFRHGYSGRGHWRR